VDPLQDLLTLSEERAQLLRNAKVNAGTKPGTPKCCGSVVKDAVELNGWISYLPCTVPENLTGPNVPGKIDRPVTGHTTPTGDINGAVPPT
jgi:hypothetical protein